MQIGDCFYDKKLDVILKISSKDKYNITIQTASYYNQTIKFGDGNNNMQTEVITCVDDVKQYILTSNWEIYHRKSLIDIDSSIMFKLTKLLNINFLTCSTLIDNFNRIPRGVGCFSNHNRIDLNFANELISITDVYIGCAKNPRLLLTPSYYISIEDYNRIKTNIDNMYDQVREIWRTISQC